ncbi:CBS domain-containing protein [Chelatococcus sp. SYSU_G07232]|uniref:CBS domain-containing protein n=1 Tax=Chelatococcus albus TaxID=3047466 RepID=A0ABT7ABD1_9HYPH|nr:CBS domain-containing protein [Chelatococcus sp. SYSU_G07232]MDJ1156638.1 CBS domain-containing protein [Chelatococcus sp. SYSU_G07232]
MRADEIMTRDVCAVGPETPLAEIARNLVERSISAVPVVDDGNRVIGMVSEGDLLRRHETGTERRRSWWLQVFVDSDTLAREYVKSHGLKAQDVMTRYVHCVPETATLADIADLLERHRIKRVPVVRAGRLVGIVSRGDLVRAFLRLKPGEPIEEASASDRSIRQELAARLKREGWADSIYVLSTVKDGIVELSGLVRSEDQRKGLLVLAGTIPGVKKVEDHLKLHTRYHGA